MPIPFFPDIGWFYLAARDAILAGHFPILGITSSVTWLHQGSLWTYFLVPFFVIFHFNPYSGVFLSLIMHFLACIGFYYVARLYFSQKIALVLIILVFSSPLLLIYSLTPYHTAPIIPFTLFLILFLLRKKYFSALLFLGFLYQLERVSLVLWFPVIYLAYKQKYFPKITHVLAFLLGALPLILAGPVEFFGPFIIPFLYHHSPALNYYLLLSSRLLLPEFFIVSLILIITSFLFLFIKKSSFIVWFIPVLIIFFQAPSEAYFIQILPFILIPVSVLLSRHSKYFLLLIFIFNVYYLISNSFMMGYSNYGRSLAEKITLVKKVGFYPEKLSLIAPGQEYSTVSDPYAYLFWYYYRQKLSNTWVTLNEYTGKLD